MSAKNDEVDPQIAHGMRALLNQHCSAPGDVGDLRALLKDAAAGGWLDLVALGFSPGDDVHTADAIAASEVLGRQVAPTSLVTAAGFLRPLVGMLPADSPLVDQLGEWAEAGAVIATPTVSLAAAEAGGESRFTTCGTVHAEPLEGRKVRLNGNIPRITDATAGVVVVCLDDGAVAAVSTNLAGVSLRSTPSVVLGLEVGSVSLEDVVIDRRLVQKAGAIEAVHHAGGVWSLVLDAYAVGVCKEMVARTVDYTSSREQFGSPIGAFQAVQHMAADMHISAETSFGVLQLASRRWVEQPRDALTDLVASRLHCSVSAMSACESAIQLHGGIGFTWELGLHHWYRAAQFARHYLTDNTALRRFLAGQIAADAELASAVEVSAS